MLAEFSMTPLDKGESGSKGHPLDARRKAKLKSLLEGLYARFHHRRILSLSSDPLHFPRRYRKPQDQEIAAFVASSLAYGKVGHIRNSVDSALTRMGDDPFRFIVGFDPKRDARRFEGFVHRFSTGLDLAVLCYLFKQVLERYGSLGNFFLLSYDEKDEDTGNALARFVERVLSLDVSPFYPGGILPREAGVRFFFPSPVEGSACKRLNLFLRWMVRKDELDLGLWSEVSPAKLIMPVDTHVARICRVLGLTRLKSASWRMAQEITKSLRELNPEDPTKYDFALCQLGILGGH